MTVLATWVIVLEKNDEFFGRMTHVASTAGFGARQALTSVLTILNYVLGDAFYLQADPSRNSLQESERAALLQHHFLDSVHFPTLARLVGELDMPFASTDAWFEEGSTPAAGWYAGGSVPRASLNL